MSADTIMERFGRLPQHVQHAIETALLSPAAVPAGSTLDAVRRARLASMVEDAERALVASKPAAAPAPSAPRAVPSPSSAATRAVAEAVRVERARLLAEHRAAPSPLPADFNAALAEVERRVETAARAGDAERASASLRLGIAELWQRSDVRATFGNRDELVALLDLRASKGTKRRS